MRRSMRSRTCGVKERAVPCSTAVCGMTFTASPAWNMQIEMTPQSIGSRLRETIELRAVTIWEPISTGSMHWCGRAAWPPLPVISMRIPSLAAGTAFFGGLKDDDGGAVEVARLAQVFGGAQQHGGVPIVAAGMHFARCLGGVGKSGGLGHRQRVHVGTH